MPLKNNFQHQRYTSDVPTVPFELIDAPFPPQLGTGVYEEQMSVGGKAIANRVDAIYLIHGTFAGNDALGWTAQFEKLWPAAAENLRELGKRLFDVLADDTGNFTVRYRDELRDMLRPHAPHLPVRRYNWSGENNHIGRCVAAVALLDEVYQRFETEKRALLLCHSHAGNVLAIISNLIGADDEQRDRFFEIIKPIFRDEEEQQILQRVTNSLADQSLRTGLQLDVVNLGTPIRYGWDSAGYRRLLNIVNHVTRDGEPAYLSPLAKLNAKNILNVDGDFVQQFAIAGTNVFPYLIDLRLQVAEYRLNKLLQPFGRNNLWEHLRMGMRVADEGTTLLVNYDDTNGLASQLAGHGVYTQSEWLAFHVEEIAKRFYL